MEDLYKKQFDLEQSSIARALLKARNTIEKGKDNPETLPTHNKVMYDIFTSSEKAIKDVLDWRLNQKGSAHFFYNKYARAYNDKYLEDVEKYGAKSVQDWSAPLHELLAYCVAECIVVKGLGEGRTLTNISVILGNQVFRAIANNRLSAEDLEDDAIVSPMMELINTARDACDFLVEVEHKFCTDSNVPNKGKTLSVTDEYKSTLDDIIGAMSAGFKYFEPMIVPPEDHKDLISHKGGYLFQDSPLLKRPMKIGGKVHQSLIDCTIESEPWLFKVINSIQQVPYAVDKEMLDLMGSILAYIDEDGSPIYDKFSIFNRDVNLCLEKAHEFAQYERIYYPIFLDQRARMYPYANTGLSYNSTDLGKSLVQYADGRVLNSDGVEALKFALGEYLGVSKRVGKPRMDEVEKRLPELLKQYNERDWSFIKGNDEPFGMISLLKELSNYYKNPTTYICRKVLHNDACSSGLQLIGLFTNCYNTMVMTNVINPTDDTLKGLYIETAKTIEKEVMYTLAHPHDVPYEMHTAACLVAKACILLQRYCY